MDLYLITTTIHMSLLSHEYPKKHISYIYLIWLVDVGGFKPSEIYESQLGLLFPTEWKVIHNSMVPVTTNQINQSFLSHYH